MFARYILKHRPNESRYILGTGRHGNEEVADFKDELARRPNKWLWRMSV